MSRTGAVLSLQRTERFGHAEVFALIGALSFLVARFVPVLSIGYACPLKALAGIPCATCGMTHAFVALAHGHVGAAVAASPLGALLAALAWAYAALDLLRAAAGWPLPVPARGAWRVATAVGIALLLANWAWLLSRGRAA
ncbi:DUF2752 domain-containing protein [Anaeromyxobacter oryzisoli]|jgi:uncharacterized protein DUF2752|uniref:DUF2752 domain-containing protein n=1 Tax=Anaeromyxobacter oryzisoli TaxID=2925408 RepID=UPI001F59B912|nr:DUF2752 domain-containing protein [Anaeromyxobacter sp. SG63]